MSLLKKIITYSSQTEPYAGGDKPLAEKIKASLPFLQLIPFTKKKVLVIGCGEGYEVKWLKDQGFKPIGITKEKKEVQNGKKKYLVDLRLAEMHNLPFNKNCFDCLFAANVLEHSVAPYVALREWRRVLKPNGWLIIVLPSKEWLAEYYHYSVLTHSQTKDLMYKAGFKLLAGPEMKPKIDYKKGDIFYDLGRGWGHYDGYVGQKTILPKKKFMLGKNKKTKREKTLNPIQLIKLPLKIPFNFIRKWYARNHQE